ncbi:MAG: exonuclease subunit SbcD [Prevotella sp.]|jgi:exonuclease SbcD|nr:exonuclease subunit SbcD [Prevotella sp.]
MKLLHTSDWHLGRMLYSKKERYAEHRQFLEWLLNTISEQSVDVLLVAGDIFDTAAPSNTSLKIYYDFLLQVRNCGCSNIVIIGGNHDSPSLLDAPKEILSALNVSVVGKARENPEDEVLVLNSKNGNPVAIVCAVPFLRERDISRFIEGESYASRSNRIAESIASHYAAVAKIACNKQMEIGKPIPVIATGHLSLAGGKTVADDGVRDTYIGSVECMRADIFPQSFDYIALGHFHIASAVGGNEKIRYSGSPIAMGFGECNQAKSVVVVDFVQNKIVPLEIPVFQKMESVCGNKNIIAGRLDELKEKDESVWIEVVYDGNELFADLTAWIDARIAGSKIEVLKVQNKMLLNTVLTKDAIDCQLENLSETDVFGKLLEEKDFPEEQKTELNGLYLQILNEINEQEE